MSFHYGSMPPQLIQHPSGFLYDQYYDVFVDPRTMTAVHPSVVEHVMASMMRSPPPMPSVNALTSQMQGVSIKEKVKAVPVVRDYPIRYFIMEGAGGGERELAGGIHEMIDILREGRDCELIIRGVFDRQIKELVILPAAGLMELYMFKKGRGGSKGEQTFHLKHGKQSVDIILSYFLTNFSELLSGDEKNLLLTRRAGGKRRTVFKKRPAIKRKTIKVK